MSSTFIGLMARAESRAIVTLQKTGEAGSGVVILAPGIEPTTIPLTLEWRGQEQKAILLAALRGLFRDIGVTGYALWLGCWLSRAAALTPPYSRRLPPGVPMPSADPNRIDAVLVAGVAKDQPTVVRLFEAMPDRSMRLIDEPGPAQVILGPFVELLA